MDLTSTAIMLATCVFFLFGLATLTGSFPLATLGAAGLAAAIMATTRMIGPYRP
ncbi:hypothetical protein ACFVVM_07430 [Nocardia sp. NPDC058176]|uniref:hypothetical protein n=1 Tax=Nocardia sp. NPDC058176 TaxID=3346368 RepID=UPI0036DA648B